MSLEFSEDIVKRFPLVENDPWPSELESEEFLYQDTGLKFFFEVSLPAALSKNQALGHILLVCPDRLTTTHFLSLLQKKHNTVASQTILLSPNTTAGDLSVYLTKANPGDMLVEKCDSLRISQSVIDVLSDAIAEFDIDITVGKGPSANQIRLDLPRFTLVMCVEKTSNALMQILPFFEYIISIGSERLSKICIPHISAKATTSISEDACEYIASRADYDIQLAERYLNRIQEAFQVSQKNGSITKQYAEEVFTIAGIGDSVQEPNDEEEVCVLVKEMHETLKAIQEDIASIRVELDSIIENLPDEF